MEKNEYKDNEKVLYKTKGRLILPHNKSEEVECFITEDHVIIRGQELTKIPMIRLKACHVWNPWFSMPHYETIEENITGAVELTFLDELNTKHKLRLEIGTDPYHFERIVDSQRAQTTSEKSSQPDPGKEVLNTIGLGIAGSFGFWLVLQGMEGAGTEYPWIVWFSSALGTGLGILVGFPWARRVSSVKRFVTFIVTGLLGAILWSLVAQGMLVAPLAAVLTAAMLVLMRLRWLGLFRWPW